MDEASATLFEQLTTAYAPYVAGKIAAYGAVDTTEAIAEGQRWLEAELSRELALAYVAQRRGPLEIFQAALVFPTDALAQAGIAAPARNEVASRALPGDVFDLAPASSRDLGDDVWMAHLQWGATKAAAILSD